MRAPTSLDLHESELVPQTLVGIGPDDCAILARYGALFERGDKGAVSYERLACAHGLRAQIRHACGSRPEIVTTFSFDVCDRAAGHAFTPYAGKLPLGLHTSMRFADYLKKLGRPIAIHDPVHDGPVGYEPACISYDIDDKIYLALEHDDHGKVLALNFCYRYHEPN